MSSLISWSVWETSLRFVSRSYIDDDRSILCGFRAPAAQLNVMLLCFARHMICSVHAAEHGPIFPSPHLFHLKNIAIHGLYCGGRRTGAIDSGKERDAERAVIDIDER